MAGLKLSSCRIRGNKGYVSENGGISSAITTGGKIAHGLAKQPSSFFVLPTGSAGTFSTTADATDITVNFGGGGSVAFSWGAHIEEVYS